MGALLGVGGFTFHYAKGTSYFSNDPKACVNCHVMQSHFDSWVKSSHHAVAAFNDCHIPHKFPDKYLVKALNGWNHSKAFTLQDFEEPLRISDWNRQVVINNCLQCHGDFVSMIAEHHGLEGRDHVRCIECHRSVGHMEF